MERVGHMAPDGAVVHRQRLCGLICGLLEHAGKDGVHGTHSLNHSLAVFCKVDEMAHGLALDAQGSHRPDGEDGQRSAHGLNLSGQRQRATRYGLSASK